MPVLATITVVTMLVAGGSVYDLGDVRDVAKDIIQDKDRSKQVLALTKSMDKEFKSYSKQINALSKQLVEMNKNYNLTREELDAFYEEPNKNRKAFLERFVELRFAAKDLTTETEWQAMYEKMRE
jgi:septal ring factor EnvC (AmiA/AmiB activator)